MIKNYNKKGAKKDDVILFDVGDEVFAKFGGYWLVFFFHILFKTKPKLIFACIHSHISLSYYLSQVAQCYRCCEKYENKEIRRATPLL